MTQYMRGVAYERKTKKYFERDGWYVVRSAGSKGAVDLVAQKDGMTINLQCKRSGIVTAMDIIELTKVKKQTGHPTYLVYPKNSIKFYMREII